MTDSNRYVVAEGSILDSLCKLVHGAPYETVSVSSQNGKVQSLDSTTTLVVYANAMLPTDGNPSSSREASSISGLRALERIIANHKAGPFPILLLGWDTANENVSQDDSVHGKKLGFDYLTTALQFIPLPCSVSELVPITLNEKDWKALFDEARERRLQHLHQVRNNMLTHGYGDEQSLDSDRYWAWELAVLQGIQNGDLRSDLISELTNQPTDWRHELKTNLIEPLLADALLLAQRYRFVALLKNVCSYLDSSADALTAASETIRKKNHDHEEFSQHIAKAIDGILEVRRFARLFEEETRAKPLLGGDKSDKSGIILFVDDRTDIAWKRALEAASPPIFDGINTFHLCDGNNAAEAEQNVQDWLELLDDKNAKDVKLILVDLAWPGDDAKQPGGIQIIQGIQKWYKEHEKEIMTPPPIAVLTNGHADHSVRDEFKTKNVECEHILHKDLTIWEEKSRIQALLSGEGPMLTLVEAPTDLIERAEWLSQKLQQDVAELEGRYNSEQLDHFITALDMLLKNEPEFLARRRTDLLSKIAVLRAIVMKAILYRMQNHIIELSSEIIQPMAGVHQYNYLKRVQGAFAQKVHKCFKLGSLQETLMKLKALKKDDNQGMNGRVKRFEKICNGFEQDPSKEQKNDASDEGKIVDTWLAQRPHIYEILSVVGLALGVNTLSSSFALERPHCIVLFIAGLLMIGASYLLFQVFKKVDQLYSDARSWESDRPGERIDRLVLDVLEAEEAKDSQPAGELDTEEASNSQPAGVLEAEEAQSHPTKRGKQPGRIGREHVNRLKWAALFFGISIVPLSLGRAYAVPTVSFVWIALLGACIIYLLINRNSRDIGRLFIAFGALGALSGSFLVWRFAEWVDPVQAQKMADQNDTIRLRGVLMYEYSEPNFSGDWKVERISNIDPVVNLDMKAHPQKLNDKNARSLRWSGILKPQSNKKREITLELNMPTMVTLNGKVLAHNVGGLNPSKVHGDYLFEYRFFEGKEYTLEVTCQTVKADTVVKLTIDNIKPGELVAGDPSQMDSQH